MQSVGDILVPVLQLTLFKKSAANLFPDKDVPNSETNYALSDYKSAVRRFRITNPKQQYRL